MNIEFKNTPAHRAPKFSNSILRQDELNTNCTSKEQAEALLAEASHTNLAKYHPAVTELQKYPSSARAMRAIYKMQEPNESQGKQIHNAAHLVDARNRFLLTRELCFEAMSEREANLLSLAGGTNDASLEALAEHHKIGLPIKGTLTDPFRNNLEVAQARATELGIDEHIILKRGIVGKPMTLRLVYDTRPSVVEVVGFFDYFNDADVVRWLRQLCDRIPDGACVIWSSVLTHSREPYNFITHPNVFNWWEMVYRSTHQMVSMSWSAGLRKTKVYTTPLGLHGVLVCSK